MAAAALQPIHVEVLHGELLTVPVRQRLAQVVAAAYGQGCNFLVGVVVLPANEEALVADRSKSRVLTRRR